MRLTLFLSRAAFISNVFFALALLLQFSKTFRNLEAFSAVLLAGYVLAMLLNPLVNLSCFVLWIARKRSWLQVPGWLLSANAVFLLMQIFYIFYLNDTNHH